MEDLKKVLVDSDAFYALINPQDANHKKARFINKKLVREKITFAVINLVVYEVANLLSYRIDQQTAIEFLDSVKDSNLEMYTISGELEKETLSLFRKQIKNKTSVVDCANIAVMQKYGFSDIFSFDKIYKLHQLRRIGLD